MKTLKVEKIDSQTYILLEDVRVSIEGYQITIKKGFDFDSASIPRIFWSIIGSPFTGNYTIPALVHDGLYASEALDRKECDNIFLELMKHFKVSYLKRYSMYWAVRLGGSNVWSKHSKDEVNKYKGYCDVKKLIYSDYDFIDTYGV